VLSRTATGRTRSYVGPVCRDVIKGVGGAIGPPF
jgi:hypothetical protein